MTAAGVWLLAVALEYALANAQTPANTKPIAVRTGGPPALYGVASWYGAWHDGKLMANGKRFRMNALTAASVTLPLGTHVRVYNLENNRHVDVEITDRGPYVPGRIIDMSMGAAKVLGMMTAGLTHVRIELLPPVKKT